MQRRHFLLAAPASLAIAAVPRVLHAQQHWLIGSCVGELVGSGSGDTRRRLTVISVDAAAGTAAGRWGRDDTAIQVSGNTVRLFTSGSNSVELTYSPPGTLEGTIQQTNSGRRPPLTIVMRRS
ncbi:MAG: hypothetical protein JWR10_3456 [Rubritepida sp.]|nr:hypothetical protein [Rubritepida sp.]